MNQKGFAPVLLIILIAAAVVSVYFAYQKLQSPKPTQVACTLDAKLCPDGSSVGRTGPNCEFSACPTPKESTSSADITNWKTYTDIQLGYKLKYPADWDLDIGSTGQANDLPVESVTLKFKNQEMAHVYGNYPTGIYEIEREEPIILDSGLKGTKLIKKDMIVYSVKVESNDLLIFYSLRDLQTDNIVEEIVRSIAKTAK